MQLTSVLAKGNISDERFGVIRFSPADTKLIGELSPTKLTQHANHILNFP
jgi:hypothetical protein